MLYVTVFARCFARYITQHCNSYDRRYTLDD